MLIIDHDINSSKRLHISMIRNRSCSLNYSEIKQSCRNLVCRREVIAKLLLLRAKVHQTTHGRGKSKNTVKKLKR